MEIAEVCVDYEVYTVFGDGRELPIETVEAPCARDALLFIGRFYFPGQYRLVRDDGETGVHLELKDKGSHVEARMV